MFDLSGRTALVSGAGQGVGAGIARALAARGAAVAVNDLVEARAAAVVESIASSGGRGAAIPGDVTDFAAVGALVDRVVEGLGPVDILVNNAGLPPDFALRPFWETHPSDWEPWLAVSLNGVMHCSRAVVEGMRERGWGRIVTIASDAGLYGAPMLAAYSAAKAGAMGFTRALAKELGPFGITCNAVALGLIEREDMATGFPVEETLKAYPVGRMGTPEDVAPAVVYLASDESSWVTGQTLAVNGGAVNVR